MRIAAKVQEKIYSFCFFKKTYGGKMFTRLQFTCLRVSAVKNIEKKYGKKWAKSNELLTSSATNANLTVAEEDAPKK